MELLLSVSYQVDKLTAELSMETVGAKIQSVFLPLCLLLSQKPVYMVIITWVRTGNKFHHSH